MLKITFSFFLLLPLFSLASTNSKEDCPGSDIAVTTPAPVEISKIVNLLPMLSTQEGKKLLSIDSGLLKNISQTFDTSKVKTKMEQFYTLLFYIGQHTKSEISNKVELDPKPVRELLLVSKVFSDETIPKQIQSVTLDRYKKNRPRFEITFEKEKTELPLNDGQGFYLFRNGLCQHAQKLIFGKAFGVTLKKNRKDHIEAQYFSGVTLFGTFGNRGVIDVDLNYIALQEVEFYKGTTDGKVTAFVAREEFKKNDHNPFLKFITRFVPDRSVQPIDW